MFLSSVRLRALQNALDGKTQQPLEQGGSSPNTWTADRQWTSAIDSRWQASVACELGQKETRPQRPADVDAKAVAIGVSLTGRGEAW